MMRRQSARKAISLGPNQIGIDNFNFTPPTLTVKAGTEVTWINNDDVPHLIVNVQNRFKQSPVLDTDQRFSAVIDKLGLRQTPNGMATNDEEARRVAARIGNDRSRVRRRQRSRGVALRGARESMPTAPRRRRASACTPERLP